MINFDREFKLNNVNGALKLRGQIEEIVDGICKKGYQNICFLGIGGTLASSYQAHIHMKEYSAIEVFFESAAEYMATGNKRITKDTVVVISSVSGSTKEMVEAVEYINKNVGATIIAFIDNKDSILAKITTHCITYPLNEQLKFFMVADRFMYNNQEFDEYYDMYKEFDEKLAQALVDVEEESDEFALEFAKKHCEDKIHYFVGAGNQYGATYSYAMCYWEEQHWIRTKSIHSAEFFHGMFEIVDKNTPVTLYIGEDSQRALSERVARFLPKVCANYTIIDTKKFALNGIKEEYRKHISHHVMHAVNNRIDVHIEKINCHPTTIRRYYRQFDY